MQFHGFMFRVLWVGGEHQNSILLPILKYLNGRAGLEHMSAGLFQVSLNIQKMFF